MTTTTRDFVAEAHESVIADIGQLTRAGKRALMREVRAGRLAKWRGCGAPWGIGPHGPVAAATYFAAVSPETAKDALFMDRMWAEYGLPQGDAEWRQ